MPYFPTPILTTCIKSILTPKWVDQFLSGWWHSLAFLKLYMIHVKELKIDQEKPELWGVGSQSPPDAWFSHSNFGHLSKKWSSTQMGLPILIWLVAFACIFEAIYDKSQKIKNQSRKSRVMEWKRTAFFVRHLKKSDFPIPILISCLQSVIAPKRIDHFWCAWCQLLAFF